MSAITVVIADRRKATRAACLRLLEPEAGMSVVAQARSGLEAIATTGRHQPHILLLDLSLSLTNSFSLLPTLRQKSPHTKVLLLAAHVSEEAILDALSHGARGYLEKQALDIFLPKAVRVVHAGEAWVPRTMVAKLMDRLARLTAVGAIQK
jgi:DNA-binding NarL/FixJ family response regulator